MSTSQESIFFFPNALGRRLLGVLHSPEFPTGSGIVYCHPFAEERQLSHVVATKTARALCDQGHTVLRFDFSGCGDSEGDLSDATFDGWLGDVVAAVRHLQDQPGIQRIVLWGLRLGANIALHASERLSPDVKQAGLLLWQPLTDLDLYMTQFLRNKLATGIAAGSSQAGSVKSLISELKAGQTVEVMGYPLGLPLYESLVKTKKSIPRWANASTMPTVILMHFSSDGQLSSPLESMHEGLKENGYAVKPIAIGDPSCWDRYWNWSAPQLLEATIRAAAGWIHA